MPALGGLAISEDNRQHVSPEKPAPVRESGLVLIRQWY